MLFYGTTNCSIFIYWSWYQVIATAKAKLVKIILQKIDFSPSESDTPWCENLGMMRTYLIFHAKAKQIEIDFHFLETKRWRANWAFSLYRLRIKLQILWLNRCILLAFIFFGTSPLSRSLCWRERISELHISRIILTCTCIISHVNFQLIFKSKSLTMSNSFICII